jgi:hypothetical protein
METPGGKSMMLGQWRVTLRQAEEAARSGRIEEALGLLARPELAEHRQGLQLAAKLSRDLLDRGKRRAAAEDLAGAMDDFDLAERHGAAPDLLAAARLTVAERADGELRRSLEAGDPARVLERAAALARRGVSSPTLRRHRESAEAWVEAQDQSRRGEFGHAREALARAARLAGTDAADALAAARADLEARQRDAQPRVEAFYAALADARDGAALLAAADGVLAVVPEHPAARQARSRAWQQVGVLHPTTGLPPRAPTRVGLGLGLDLRNAPPEPIVFLDEHAPEPEPADPARPAAPESGPSGRALLWVDAVGGFLVCLDREVVLGRAGHDSQADIPLLGDLSRRHASLIRQGDGYVVRAWHPTFVNGRQVVGTAPLRDRDVLRLGSAVELVFRQPSPVSATARLELVSRHRLPLAVDAVILMAETCILGAPPQAHVAAKPAGGPVVLFRQGGRLWCRAPGRFEVDGRPERGRAALAPRSRVQGDGFSFGVEPLESPAA